MGKIRAKVVKVTTTGGAGSATGNADSEPFVGEIIGVYLNFHASAPATTDITITDKHSGVEIASEDNAVADKYIAPVIFGESNAGAGLTGDVTPQRYAVGQGVNVAVSGADALTNALVATVLYRS